jgi:hypothetical protein
MYENTSRTTIAEFYNGAPDETFFDQIRETGVTQIHTFFRISGHISKVTSISGMKPSTKFWSIPQK